jgi:thioesterase domain-containing protein
MLVPVQTSGAKPPLFFVHGLHGVMPLGPDFARVLGPEQPLYAVNANGMEGRRPVTKTIRDMIPAYVEEIEQARPAGPLVVGGMCDGIWAAIELVRTLRQRGRQVGPVILVDPPIVARSYESEDAAADPAPQIVEDAAVIEVTRKLQEKARSAGLPPPGNRPDLKNLKPEVERQLYQQVQRQLLGYASRPYLAMPFDIADEQQLHLAVLAGVGSVIAFCSHLPTPLSSPAQLILSDHRALGFFHREMPWHVLLPGPRMVHVLPGDHIDLFGTGRQHVARAIRLMLEQGPRFEALTARSISSPGATMAALNATTGAPVSGQI